ncbi:MAG: hypothetical protein ACK5B9_12885 [Flavobacteriia bacterium]|jgi:hypothetical protein
MKTTFNNSDLVHTFAQRTQSNGTTQSGSMYFEGNKIYSYGRHYVLGEFIDNNTILINDRGYSNTTCKHIHLLTNATNQYKQYFFSAVNLDCVYNSIINNFDKLGKAKKPENYIIPIINKFESLQEFLKLYKKVNDLKSDKFKEIKKIYSSLKKDESKFLESIKQAEKKKAAKELKKFNEDLQKFFNYEINTIYKNNLKEDYLRISEDRTQIETTQNVKIDVLSALNLYRMIEAGKDIKGYRISNYTVISLNGHLKVGCHNINVKNMHEIGKQLKALTNV